MGLLARALRPGVSRLYEFKRRHRIGNRFLAHHPGFEQAVMAFLRPFKSDSVVDVHGHLLKVDPVDYLGLSINRAYEPDVTHFFKNSVRNGQTAIDVGAHIGYFTLLLARLVGPAGRVVAFEPDAENFELLERNVRANGYANVALHRQAVADRSGPGLLYRSPVNPGDHRLVDDGCREAVEIEVVSLDNALLEFRGSVHWIKMDVQGAELSALRGMRFLIDSCPELAIVLEFYPRGLAQFGADPAELLALLAGLGFGVNEILADGTSRVVAGDDVLGCASIEDGTYLNLLFTRPVKWRPGGDSRRGG
jgi:FkbM family methyltransferase